MSIMPGSGDFEVCEAGALVVSGRVSPLVKPLTDLPPVDRPASQTAVQLTGADIYKELRLRGYDYGPTFQGILSANNEGIYNFRIQIHDTSISLLMYN